MAHIIYSSPIYDKLSVGTSAITLREERRRARGRKVVAIIELDGKAIDASTTRRGFRYLNHCCSPNTFTRLTGDRAESYALRRIRAGEELTVDYGLSHHDVQLPCQCGAAQGRGWI